MVVKILTTKNATDRLINALRHLERHGFTPEVVYAIEDNDPKISFNKSMRHIMQTTNEDLLLFEDDVILQDNAHLQKAFSQLPNDWEICYLGANLIDPVERFSDNLFRTFGAWTTHAVYYKNPQEIGRLYTNTEHMFDDWLKQNICANGKAYVVSPMIAWQSVHKSDLWGHVADYTNIFNLSAQKLI